MKKIIFLLLLSFTSFAQNGWYNGWGLRGNALSSNTNFIGTTTNRSFSIKTYTNLGYAKFDSVGKFIVNRSAANFEPAFQIFNRSSGTNAYSGIEFISDALGIGNNFMGVTGSGSAYLTPNKFAFYTQQGFEFFTDALNPTIFNYGANNKIISLGLTNNYFNNKTTIGSSVTSTGQPTLNVIGTMSVSSTATVNNLVVNGANSNYAAVVIASSSNTIGVTSRYLSFDYLSGQSDSRRWWIGNDFNEYGDFGIFTENTQGTSAPTLANNKFYINKNGNVGINKTSLTATLDISGTMSVSSTASVNGIELVSGSMSVTTKGINTTAGDAATINSPAGRFRKDTSGTTFTLTNSFITANSILIITLASDPGAPLTHAIWTSCSAGSATITWDAAPTNNTDVNFFLVN